MMATAPWRAHLAALASAILLIIVLFARDAWSMATIWWTSSTYTHCLFIIPLVGWLAWQRRRNVASIAPGAWWPGIIAIGCGGFMWVLGEAAGVTLVRHVAIVALVQAVVLTMLGPSVVQALLFPLFYLIFLVPFGDEFIPVMQMVTARLAMSLLAVSGVKATLDGVFITTPDGWFEVAEACSGVKFLVAMIAYGSLVANVCFRRWSRRLTFMTLCVVVPVLANGVRAFATIYAAHLTDVATATSFDHIVYGWIFFAFVMVLVMAMAWPFFDRKPGDAWITKPSKLQAAPRPILMTLATVAFALLMPKLWDTALSAHGRVSLPGAIALPEVAGWRHVAKTSGHPWVPRFDGADHILYGRYANLGGQQVDLAIALYGWQGGARKIVGFGQGAVDGRNGWSWTSSSAGPFGSKADALRGPDRRLRTALTFYVVSGRATGDAMTVKLRTLKARLTGSDQSAGVLIASAEGEDRDAALTAFTHALGSVDRRIVALTDQSKGR